jgi:hypothetical protein
MELMKASHSEVIFWGQRGIEGYTATVTKRGLPDIELPSEHIRGGRLDPLIRLVQLGQRTTVENELGRMRQLKSKWQGRIDEAPRDGLVYIVNSQSWLDFLEDMGVKVTDRGAGVGIALTLAKYLGRNETMPLGEVGRLAEWYEGTSMDAMPLDLTPAELRRCRHDDLMEYYKDPTSLEQRDLNREDSRWLIMASQLERQAFSFEKLKKLKGEFRVPFHRRESLDRTYGLFTQAK